MGPQPGFGWIKIIEEDLVEAEITDDGDIFAGNGGDEMRVRPGLPVAINTRAAVLNDRKRLAEFPVGCHRKRSNAAAAVVCNQHAFSLWVEREVTRTGAARGLLIQ